jgi:hypothetical protein
MQTMAVFVWSKPNFKFARVFLDIMLVRCIQDRYITLCLVDNSSSAPGQTSGSHCCDTLPREGIWQPAANLLASLVDVTHNPCVNSFHMWAHGLCKWWAYRPTNHKQNPLRWQQMAKVVPVFTFTFPATLAKIILTCWCSFSEEKTWNLKHKFWIPVSSARYCDMMNKRHNTGASIDGRCYTVAW